MSAYQNPYSQFFNAMNEFQNSFMANFNEKSAFPAPSSDAYAASQQFFKNARKNYQAATGAAKAVIDLTQTVTRHGAEYSCQVAEAVADFLEETSQVTNPQEGFEKQARFAKDLSDHAISNSKELSEIISKSGAEVSEIVNARFSEALNEVSDITNNALQTAGQQAEKAASGANTNKKKAA